MNYDKLTNLLYFDDFKEKAADIIKKTTGRRMIISMNISNFKYVNNVYGYEMGDKLLARITQHFYHENDRCLLAARIHSDRFVALVQLAETEPERIKEVFGEMCRQFMCKIEKDYPIAAFWIHSGVYLFDEVHDSVSEMLDKAEIARRNIGAESSTAICFFTEELEKRNVTEGKVIPLFERALREDAILVYLQPKIDIDTQKIIGAEALARMVDEDGNMIPPNIFIPVLEKYGLIVQLDMYVTRKVVSLLNSWHAGGMKLVPISVNLSRVDFNYSEDWASDMEKEEKLHVPLKYLEFEITETVFFEDIAKITRVAQFLRERGFRISMDDFGTGYSSLNTLSMLPLDCIKFDRGFVQNCINNRKGLEIMAGLIGIFDKIELEVVCEGVETLHEEQIMRACGCRRVQGYLHDKPMPIPEFEAKYLQKTTDT